MIELKNICKKYGDFTVFDNVNTVINEGDVIAIIGPSGCGKSTLLNSINVLDRASSGQVLYNGVDIMDSSCNLREYRMKMGMVFQAFNLFGHMTILENAIVPQIDLLGRSRQDACDKAMEYLRLVGMADRALSYPAELSGGQKQRAAIARTLSMDPEVLLLDEPTSALDPTMVGEVEYVLKKLAKQGRTMVIVTHEMRFAKEISNRVFYMDEKGIYEEGPTSQIFNNPNKEKTRQFINRLKCLEINITPDNFDLAAAMGSIKAYGIRFNMPDNRIRKMQLLFEEFCICGLMNNNKISDDDNSKQTFATRQFNNNNEAINTSNIRVVFEYNVEEDSLTMNVHHFGINGKNGQDCLNEYSSLILGNISKEIEVKEFIECPID